MLTDDVISSLKRKFVGKGLREICTEPGAEAGRIDDVYMSGGELRFKVVYRDNITIEATLHGQYDVVDKPAPSTRQIAGV